MRAKIMKKTEKHNANWKSFRPKIEREKPIQSGLVADKNAHKDDVRRGQYNHTTQTQ